ncbi:MAG: DUF1080 domain-containing protein [Bryobacteraceae bacterium]|jgi:hypothetical protein
MTRQTFLKLAAAGIPAAALRAQQAAAPQTNRDLGFTDTPMLPGLPWHVHDPNRPHPEHIQPANTPGGPPSDAVVLFDGGDLSRWVQRGKGADAGKLVDARWKVGDGWFEVAPETGDLLSREKFGDCQIHVEWSSPTEIHANSQARGNSGVLIMSRYEIQVLDAWQNPTYADGQAGAIYGQWPPLVNPARRPGEWNTYDIVFDAPRFDGQKLVRPGYVTVFYNDVVVHHHKEIRGAMVYRKVATYTAHAPEEPLMLQAHHDPVRYRNVWVRRLNGYDRPEA